MCGKKEVIAVGKFNKGEEKTCNNCQMYTLYAEKIRCCDHEMDGHPLHYEDMKSAQANPSKPNECECIVLKDNLTGPFSKNANVEWLNERINTLKVVIEDAQEEINRHEISLLKDGSE